jgi:hypothetical protein
MHSVVVALALLAQTSSIVGQQAAFVVGEKVAGSLVSTMLSSNAWVA